MNELDFSRNGNPPEGLPLWVNLLFIILILLYFAAYWKIFTKAGKPGWVSIIPFYNIVVFSKLIGKPDWWAILFFPLINIVIFILMHHHLAKVFGKNVWFTMGLLVFNPIFVGVLAFGKSKYDKPFVIQKTRSASHDTLDDWHYFH